MDKCDMTCSNQELMPEQDIETELQSLDGWSYDSKQKTISKTFDFKGFYGAMGFVNAVAFIAQKNNHHPDMQVSYNQVVIHYQTHSAGGVTALDILCAHKIDQL